ncbi:MBL fold metallo-hydrolase [Brumimicrobium aurantiacum]|uniref:MBL fold metallo-hydrolase n=1 Tax=Brumimicrobium aurantiacum TaxID=1737063 RepID=A0A3E1F038_9FLAO|nr:MBL fold metallo-hydrolase [Brumimicrobium aurantiacum]RFC55170.1 MBL fold metallo-hydrolase [Brumimicrobium aurantiacum]
MKERFTVKVLGTGTSQGVPVIGCECEVCTSNDPKDNRLRSSILINWKGENFVVDSGPDFRQQMLRENVKSLRAVLYTHEHKDHVAGMDDVRSYNFLEKRDMELYCNEDVSATLKREFHYAFGDNLYPGVPRVNINLVENKPFQLLDGPMVTPILMYHYKMPVYGYRIGDFAYLTDVKTIPPSELEKLKGVKTLILDCLREEPHISHLSLEEALDIIRELKPNKTYLTHISHLFGTHEQIKVKLPENVFPAFDGLEIDVQ